MTNRIVQECMARGCYTLSAGTLEPAVVLRRLLEALRELDRTAHDALIAPDSEYACIPPTALRDEMDRWWGSEPATQLVEDVIHGIDRSVAAHGLLCNFVGADHFVIERFEGGSGSGVSAAAAVSGPPPKVSVLRARVRP